MAEEAMEGSEEGGGGAPGVGMNGGSEVGGEEDEGAAEGGVGEVRVGDALGVVDETRDAAEVAFRDVVFVSGGIGVVAMLGEEVGGKGDGEETVAHPDVERGDGEGRRGGRWGRGRGEDAGVSGRGARGGKERNGVSVLAPEVPGATAGGDDEAGTDEVLDEELGEAEVVGEEGEGGVVVGEGEEGFVRGFPEVEEVEEGDAVARGGGISGVGCGGDARGRGFSRGVWSGGGARGGGVVEGTGDGPVEEVGEAGVVGVGVGSGLIAETEAADTVGGIGFAPTDGRGGGGDEEGGRPLDTGVADAPVEETLEW